MTITALINNVDFAPVLSTWNVTHEITFSKVVSSLNGADRAFGRREKTIISFSLLPYTEEECAVYYDVLSAGIVSFTFTDNDGAIKEKEMRLISDLESIFLLDSIDGKRRYKGATITLRQTGVN